MIDARIRLTDVAVSRWANGRGETRELLREVDAAGALRLRLSVAHVEAPGPFSPLPGIDRVLVVIDGPGFDLSLDGRRVSARLGEPLAFAGSARAAALHVSAPSMVFNVMAPAGSRPGVGMRRRAFQPAVAAGWLYVATGAFSLGEERIAAGELVRHRAGGVAATGGGLLLEVLGGTDPRPI